MGMSTGRAFSGARPTGQRSGNAVGGFCQAYLIQPNIKSSTLVWSSRAAIAIAVLTVCAVGCGSANQVDVGRTASSTVPSKTGVVSAREASPAVAVMGAGVIAAAPATMTTPNDDRTLRQGSEMLFKDVVNNRSVRVGIRSDARLVTPVYGVADEKDLTLLVRLCPKVGQCPFGWWGLRVAVGSTT